MASPLASTCASLLNTTENTFPKCPCRRRRIVPDATSHTKTVLSPPQLANFALSCALRRQQGAYFRGVFYVCDSKGIDSHVNV
jgi:hypothetical protein